MRMQMEMEVEGAKGADRPGGWMYCNYFVRTTPYSRR